MVSPGSGANNCMTWGEFMEEIYFPLQSPQIFQRSTSATRLEQLSFWMAVISSVITAPLIYAVFAFESYSLRYIWLKNIFVEILEF